MPMRSYSEIFSRFRRSRTHGPEVRHASDIAPVSIHFSLTELTETHKEKQEHPKKLCVFIAMRVVRCEMM